MQRTQSKYNILTYKQLANFRQKVNFSSNSHATDINSEKEIFPKIGKSDSKTKEKQNKIRSELGVFQQLSGSKKDCKLKINWKGKSGKINRQMHIINGSENSIKRLQLSDLNESSAQLNPQDTDTSKDEQQSLLHGLRQFETQTSLGTIILSRQDHEQHCFKLILNYYRLQTFIKYVEMSCENIELRPNQKSKGYAYKLENLPPPIQSLRNYCVQVIQTIRQIFKDQDQHNLSIQSKINCRDCQLRKIGGNIFRHEYAFPFEDKTIQLGISQQGEAIISIYQQLQQQSIESAQSSSTHDPKPKLMQVHKFANLDLLLKPHYRQCLASLMGQALLTKIIQIYTNHWFLYVADL